MDAVAAQTAHQASRQKARVTPQQNNTKGRNSTARKSTRFNFLPVAETEAGPWEKRAGIQVALPKLADQNLGPKKSCCFCWDGMGGPNPLEGSLEVGDHGFVGADNFFLFGGVRILKFFDIEFSEGAVNFFPTCIFVAPVFMAISGIGAIISIPREATAFEIEYVTANFPEDERGL